MSAAHDDGGGIASGFVEHLEALRMVLIRIAVVVIALGVAAFCFMSEIFDRVIMWPCRADFPSYRLLDKLASLYYLPGELGAGTEFSLHPTSLELTSQFFVHVSASCWAAVIGGFPAIIYFLWSFVAPGLYEHEKRGIKRAFFFGNLMFFLGVLVGYFVVFPLTLRFLATYSISSEIHTMVSLDSYMDNFFGMILVMGAVFELPLLAWLMGKMGFLRRNFFGAYRRHAIVALLVVAALITPTGDPFSLFVVFLPIYALWEMSARLVPKN